MENINKTCKDCISFKTCWIEDEQNNYNFEETGCKTFEDKSLFIKQPCKVGDDAFLVKGHEIIQSKVTGMIFEVYGQGDFYNCTQNGFGLNLENNPNQYSLDCIGKTIFFNKEDAEKVLKRVEYDTKTRNEKTEV